MPQEKIPLVAVVGPTASGKTRLAIELCKALDGQVVSGDSMQLYKQLSIATAKPTRLEQQEVPHHLIDLIEPWESFSVAQYTALAGSTIAALHKQGKLAVVCGGTGLYIRALLQNITFTPQPTDPVYREELRALAASEGNGAVHRLLEQKDPAAAAALHPNNLGRVIRALEVCKTTGGTMSAQQQAAMEVPSPYHACVIGLDYRRRQTLYDRINLRVTQMVEQGLLEEAKAALALPLSPTASQAIGYKELRPYLEGNAPLDEVLDALRMQSRRYAKRQLTWFRREPDIHWLYAEDYADPAALAAAAITLARQTLGQT